MTCAQRRCLTRTITKPVPGVTSLRTADWAPTDDDDDDDDHDDAYRESMLGWQQRGKLLDSFLQIVILTAGHRSFSTHNFSQLWISRVF